MFIVVQPEIREYNKLYFLNTRESEEQKQKLGKKRGKVVKAVALRWV